MHESDVSLNAAQAARAALVNGGSLRYFAGTRPVNVAAGIGAATLISTNTYGVTAFGSPSAGVVTANAIGGANAVANGTISFAGSYTSGGVLTWLHDVGLSGSGAECIVDSLSATLGLPVNTLSMTLTQPDGAYGS